MVVVAILEVKEEVNCGIVLNAALLGVGQVLGLRLARKVHLVVRLGLTIGIDESLRDFVHSLGQLVLYLLVEQKHRVVVLLGSQRYLLDVISVRVVMLAVLLQHIDE